ncbi:MAG: hypothetical protein LQ346_007608 [Caloplaca aetnensis]|nr:MAG: hypothetical protein LQ346_007608 [Caloplaca aetnensis]
MPSHPDESTPLRAEEPNKRDRQLRKYLLAPIDLHHAYLPLLACCFVTGIIDAGAYNAWGTFMGMQTGNTIFLALGVAGLPENGAHLKWLRSLLSISTFMLGSLISATVTRPYGNTRRLSLSINFLLQGISILVAAILITTDAIPENDADSDKVLIGIPFLAWQFGAQVAASRALGYGEIPTTVLTSIYNDLASDPRLWTWRNAKRNRRAGAAVMVLVGGICGGWLSRLEDGFGIVLWIGGAIKILLSIAWLGYDEATE